MLLLHPFFPPSVFGCRNQALIVILNNLKCKLTKQSSDFVSRINDKLVVLKVHTHFHVSTSDTLGISVNIFTYTHRIKDISYKTSSYLSKANFN